MRRFVDGVAAFSCRLLVDLASPWKAPYAGFLQGTQFCFLVFFLWKIWNEMSMSRAAWKLACILGQRSSAFDWTPCFHPKCKAVPCSTALPLKKFKILCFPNSKTRKQTKAEILNKKGNIMSWGYECPVDIPPGWKGRKDSWPMQEPVVSQPRSWEAHHCSSLDQQVLSKEVKKKKTKDFSGRERKGQKRERTLARSLLKPGVQLHLCSSSAAKHRWTWTKGMLWGCLGKSHGSWCV